MTITFYIVESCETVEQFAKRLKITISSEKIQLEIQSIMERRRLAAAGKL